MFMNRNRKITVGAKLASTAKVIENMVTFLGMWAMLLLVFLPIVIRLITGAASPAWEVFSRWAWLWTIALAAIVATREDKHIEMDLFGIFAHSPRKLLFYLTTVKLASFIFFCLLSGLAWEYVFFSIRLGEQESVIRLPLYLAQGSFAVGFTGVTIRFLILFIKDIVRIRITMEGGDNV
jgi:TRAP-type C4-dicarboxylate transport system permease small subunit